MITFLVSDLNQNPMIKLLRRGRKRLPPMQFITYERAFYRKWVSGGALVFTDFDLLTDFELDAAGIIAKAAEDKGVPVLNHPARVLERAMMHRQFAARAKPAVEVSRLQDNERPTRFPAFIRMQGGCVPPDTGLLHNEGEFDTALADLKSGARPLRGRIAMTFEASPDQDGYYRKYGAFRIGDAIVPQHVVRNRHWYIKRADQSMDDAFAREQLSYIQNNPHEDQLRDLFEIAGHEFGRADYTIHKGELIVFEINSNPSFPNLSKADESVLRTTVLNNLRAAFEGIKLSAQTERVTFQFDRGIGRNITRKRWQSFARVRWTRRLDRTVDPTKDET